MTTWKLTGRKRMAMLPRWGRSPLVVVQVQEVVRRTAWYMNGLTSTVTNGTETEYRWRNAHPNDLLPRVAGDVSRAHLDDSDMRRRVAQDIIASDTATTGADRGVA